MTTGTEADKPSDQTGSPSSNVVRSGQISDEMTVRAVLEQILLSPDVPHGVLRILSKEVRGHIGVQDGRVITGAHLTSTDEYGRSALVKLLGAPKGLYAFLNLPHPQPELNQLMNLVIAELVNYRPEGYSSNTLPDLGQCAGVLLASMKELPADFAQAAASQAAQNQLVKDTEEQFASIQVWGGETKPTGGMSTFGSILGQRKTDQQKVPVERIPQAGPPVQPTASEPANQAAPPSAAQSQPPVPAPGLMISPPPPPNLAPPVGFPNVAPANTGQAPKPQAAPEPQRPTGQQHLHGMSPPLPPRQTGQIPQGVLPPSPTQSAAQPPHDQGQPPHFSRTQLDSIPTPGHPGGTHTPAPLMATGHAPERPNPAIQEFIKNKTTGNQDPAQSSAGPTSSAQPQPGMSRGATMPAAMGMPAQGSAAQATAAHAQTQAPAGPRLSPQQAAALEKRTSERMKAMSMPVDDGFVAPVQEVKKIGKDVVAGGIVGTGLLLLLASQSFQALAYKAHFQDGVAALKSSKNEVAVVEFSSSISANPSDAKAYFLRGLAEARMNNNKAALEDYSKVIAMDSKNLRALVARASLYNRMKNFDAAVMDCNKAIQMDPTMADAFRVRAMSFNQSGRFSEALADSKTFMDLYNSQPQKNMEKEVAEVYSSSAYADFNKHNFDASIADYTEAIKQDPNNGQLYASRAVVYKQLHDWKLAIADVNKAIELLPGDTTLFKIRGVCYAGLGESEKAAADLNNLVKYNPSVENHRMRGQARLEVHDYRGALDDFDFVLGAQPHDQDARAKYQQARLGLNGSVKVRSLVEDALAPIKHKPINLKQTEPQLVKEGYDLMLAGNAEDAQQYLSEAVRKNPADATARRYLAYTLIEEGSNADAVAQFSALAQLQQLPPGDMMMYAKALNDAGEPEQGVKVYQNILSGDATNDRARSELIKAYLKAGSNDQAAKLANEGKQISPAMKDSYDEFLKQAQNKK